MIERLRLVIRMPHAVVLDEDVAGARIPSESGQVGLRPRAEPFVVSVEPGLVLLRTDGGLRFAATAGGLLESHRQRAELLTPYAVVGERDADVLDALERALAVPDGDIEARRRLGELEQRIVQELRHRPVAAAPRRSHG